MLEQENSILYQSPLYKHFKSRTQSAKFHKLYAKQVFYSDSWHKLTWNTYQSNQVMNVSSESTQIQVSQILPSFLRESLQLTRDIKQEQCTSYHPYRKSSCSFPT